MWNSLLDVLFHVQFTDFFTPFCEDIDLAKIALSCHFALDLLCYKEEAFFIIWHHCLRILLFSWRLGTIATAGNLVLRTPAT